MSIEKAGGKTGAKRKDDRRRPDRSLLGLWPWFSRIGGGRS